MDNTRNFYRAYEEQRPAGKTASPRLALLYLIKKFFCMIFAACDDLAAMAEYRLFALRKSSVAASLPRVAVAIFERVKYWLLSAGILLFFGIVGGVEAGLISFAVGIPVLTAVVLAAAYISRHEK